MDAIEQFKDAMRAHGLTPPEIIPDGRLHRFSTNGKRGDDSGWYVFHDDGIPAGAFGDWRTDIKRSWRADIGRTLTPAEEAAHQRKVDAMRRAREAEEAQRKAEAREKAATIWQGARPAPDDHAYLRRKGVKGHGMRLYRGPLVVAGMPCDGSLIVPACGGGGAIHTLQFIHSEKRDGDNKRFLPGGDYRGRYFSIGTMEGGPLCLCEGYATGASIYEATGYLAAVAFNAGNVGPVAQSLRARFPNSRLIVCADDDPAPDGNPGLAKAKEAAIAVGGRLAVPDFGENRPDWASDFNDMAKHLGSGAVAECIRRQVESGASAGEGVPEADEPNAAAPGDESSSSGPGSEGVSGNGAARNAPTTTVAEVLQVFHKWLYLPDEGSVYVPLGAVAANLMEGDPVWVMVVGPPSGGKTESIFAIASLPYVHLGATLTEAALLSGTPKKQKTAGSKGGLLREIGDFGILALKDFTSILAMNRDQRGQLLAALREIFDGSWTRHVGVDGGRTLTWSGKLGLIAGCTAAIDSHHAVMSIMGERFILYRLPTIDPAKQAERALANAGQVRVMRTELAVVVRKLFTGLDFSKKLPPIDAHETTRLVALSSLVASARSAVERDPYRREIDLVLDTEAPARLAQTLRRLYAGMLAIGLDRATAWPLVAKTGLDCIPKLRRSVFDALLATPDWRDTTTFAAATQHPTITARRSLEDLSAHGVVDRRPGGKGKPDLWRVSDLARTRYEATFSEMSVGEKTPPTSPSPPPPPHTPVLNNPSYRMYDDISDTPPETASECGSQGGFGGNFESSESSVDRHCWACKGAMGDADRCPTCGWFVCSCGACSPDCADGYAESASSLHPQGGGNCGQRGR